MYYVFTSFLLIGQIIMISFVFIKVFCDYWLYYICLMSYVCVGVVMYHVPLTQM